MQVLDVEGLLARAVDSSAPRLLAQPGDRQQLLKIFLLAVFIAVGKDGCAPQLGGEMLAWHLLAPCPISVTAFSLAPRSQELCRLAVS